MNEIHVSCAIIIKNDKILLAQRSINMQHPLLFEFPGGKIEENESPEESIQREIIEELSCTITIHEKLPLFRHNYNNRAIVLHPFICHIKTGTAVNLEHRQIVWSEFNKLSTFEWVEADIAIYEYLTEKYTTLKNECFKDDY
ncbi:(deoxy)nucleoside triphosphate pyrophosphohydrolase [Saccharicrinis aurantiacus]|uniref:(deoxy)nucleoside triphosphate pyrophosphohydrolase n=1 Tax=Saccharicrinis aurantiacus TaxID=1849719 RepID=UPI00094FE09B|nr:(deoxy)nucleoside triphosphate pyrophosphohydrolase [Saccharicrinis aurantiacus]